MFTLLFFVLSAIGIFKLMCVIGKATWGLTKCIIGIIVWPIVIVTAMMGILWLTIPLLIIGFLLLLVVNV